MEDIVEDADTVVRIDDVIQRLQEIKREYGNIEVRVQYRDSGGDYYGCDNVVYLNVADAFDRDYLNGDANAKHETMKIVIL